MMRAKLIFSITLALVGFFNQVAVDAQGAARVARIGYLGDSPTRVPELRVAFLKGLSDLGYIEGRNLVIEYRLAEGHFEHFPALAAELVALKVDVIFAVNPAAALAAKQATKTLPIVFSAVSDPVAIGLVSSLGRPGGNVTGLSLLTPELVGKCMELLKEAVPAAGRVAVLSQAGGTNPRSVKEAEVAVRALGMRLQVVEVRGPDDFDKAFSEMTRARADALAVLSTPMFLTERRRLVALAAKSRLPAVYPWREAVEAGGFLAYGTNLPDLYRRAATHVDKILKGAKPGDLPVEQPTKFELVINLKAGQTLGLTVPPSLLARADEVIEK